jgi:hypothetical protein
MPGRIRPGVTAERTYETRQAADERKAKMAEDAFRQMMQQRQSYSAEH